MSKKSLFFRQPKKWYPRELARRRRVRWTVLDLSVDRGRVVDVVFIIIRGGSGGDGSHRDQLSKGRKIEKPKKQVTSN